MVKKANAVQFIECPRDAMQGWPHIISTEKKVAYLDKLLQAGFEILDCGSFVSPKAIPQMADTRLVLSQLNLDQSDTKLLVIVANERGAQEAVTFEKVSYLGFPFSVSETFQNRNTNSTIEESMLRVEQIFNLCTEYEKQLVVYLSMAFGNPYHDAYNEEIVLHWAKALYAIGLRNFSLADTVGLANAQQVKSVTKTIIDELPQINISVHLHSDGFDFEAKLNAAYDAGCRRFEGAINGIGGCPMAGNDLVGNMDTVKMLHHFSNLPQVEMPVINESALKKGIQLADEIFRA